VTVDRYPHLLSPLRIGPVRVRNRILQSAHEKFFHQRDGLTTRRDLHYQRERAEGGAGLLITGHRPVHPTSPPPSRGFPFGYRKEFARAERAVTAAVHEAGAAIFAQINHVGMCGSGSALDDYRFLLAPSSFASVAFNETPKAMEEADFAMLEQAFADTAAVACESGYDGVELHMANGYLLHQFMTPVYNKRRDEYGGSLDGRLRFPLRVLRAVRERVGRDVALGVRLSVSDMMAGGLEAEEWAEIAQRIEATGWIDFVDTSAGTYNSGAWSVTPGDLERGWALERAALLKKALRAVPLFAVGGIGDPEMAERAIATQAADMVAMTRALIADPALPRKLAEGRESEIVHCIRCNQGCTGRIVLGRPVTCILNPAAGREERFGGAPRPAHTPGRWVVVGGGPAGMKAAAGLAQRGHRVTLLEREGELGGQVRWILATPRRDGFAHLVRDLAGELARRRVEVRLGVAADEASVLALAPDGVVLATGSRPERSGRSPVAPEVDVLPGLELSPLLTGLDALRDPERVGHRVLLLDDEGSRYALGVAEKLAQDGHEVHVVTRFNAIGPATAVTLDQGVLYAALFGLGVVFETNHWVRRLEADGALVYNLYTGVERRLEGFDSVVLVGAHVPEDELHHALAGRVARLHRIGDCLAPRRLDQALYEGFLAGREQLDLPERFIDVGELEGPLPAP